MKKRKNIIGLLLALALTIGIVPQTALADAVSMQPSAASQTEETSDSAETADTTESMQADGQSAESQSVAEDAITETESGAEEVAIETPADASLSASSEADDGSVFTSEVTGDTSDTNENVAESAADSGVAANSEENSNGIKIDYDSTTDIHSVVDTAGNTIILYCMNNQLHWPHGEDAPLYTETTIEDFCKDNKITDPEKIKNIENQLKQIIYAGYPNNGYGLYSIVDNASTVSEEDFNGFLNPPQNLRSDFPNSVGSYTFTYNNRTSGEQQEKLSEFLKEVFKLHNSGGRTESGLTYQEITQLPFWRAAYVLENFDSDPIETYSNLYINDNQDYSVTEKQAYESMSHAIWTLMNELEIKNNDIIDRAGLSGKILDTSIKGETILTKEPVEDNISIKGNTSFSYNTDDKMWHTGDLSIETPYSTNFQINLPDGIQEKDNKTLVKAGDTFSFVSSKPIASASITLFSTIPWMKSDLKIYKAVENATAGDGKGFQDMVGAVIDKKTVKKEVKLSTNLENPITSPTTSPTDTPSTSPEVTATPTASVTPEATTTPTKTPAATTTPSSTPAAQAVPEIHGGNSGNGTNNTGSSGNNYSTASTNKVSTGAVRTGAVSTGDSSNRWIWQIALSVSVVLLVLFLYMVFRSRKKHA
ncbi:MAG: hypothetical protein MR218_06500 [Eubacterium sp.]|nr:hypothetical protein [Eubacterium sp.]